MATKKEKDKQPRKGGEHVGPPDGARLVPLPPGQVQQGSAPPDPPDGDLRKMMVDGEWLPEGDADGVFFLGRITDHILMENDEVHVETIVPSDERKAVKHLRAPDPEWRARNRRRTAMCRPNAPFLAPKKLREAGKATGRPVKYLFVGDRDEIVELDAARNFSRVRLVEKEPNIWAAYVMPASTSSDSLSG